MKLEEAGFDDEEETLVDDMDVELEDVEEDVEEDEEDMDFEDDDETDPAAEALASLEDEDDFEE
ncbi:hypothetical protein COX05_01885 [candidate division WWE3 bacterium CG22_combo_CG10-13_8_21_14_all_39_12]|uniref:Uncharacterized protein n=2 Tax=Katanobacteria TaxID=422282 RepID=A0A2M7X1M8_UNCKA|nr:MAG: hypothetical protein COX05_01885 [candidate division WWE3 bacterium CG22_combo_CG10-13_8_21_14_all_39_12]PJA39999.1 MAG: hypothetical protein CO179_03720 [candidate division WWE3 bacterium CG_4_9_14_3_um_filter_39_7]